MVFDNARNETNPANKMSFANTTAKELSGSNYEVDFLANGFKIRSDQSGDYNLNIGGNDYIYFAVAEDPFKYSTAR